jgi:5'-3' exonuclease
MSEREQFQRIFTFTDKVLKIVRPKKMRAAGVPPRLGVDVGVDPRRETSPASPSRAQHLPRRRRRRAAREDEPAARAVRPPPPLALSRRVGLRACVARPSVEPAVLPGGSGRRSSASCSSATPSKRRLSAVLLWGALLAKGLLARERRGFLRRSAFDSNCITPGTEFMHRLGLGFRAWLSHKFKTDPFYTHGPVVMFSGRVLRAAGGYRGT